MNAMREFWSDRDPRERLLLSVLAAIAVFMLLFQFALKPMLNSDSSDTPLTVAQADREMFLRAAPQIGGASASGARAVFQRAVLIDTARKRDIKLSRVQPDGRGGLTVWVEDAPTQALYGLFDDILSGYQVEMSQSTVTLSDAGGLDAQFTLKTD